MNYKEIEQAMKREFGEASCDNIRVITDLKSFNIIDKLTTTNEFPLVANFTIFVIDVSGLWFDKIHSDRNTYDQEVKIDIVKSLWEILRKYKPYEITIIEEGFICGIFKGDHQEEICENLEMAYEIEQFMKSKNFEENLKWDIEVSLSSQKISAQTRNHKEIYWLFTDNNWVSNMRDFSNFKRLSNHKNISVNDWLEKNISPECRLRINLFK